MTDTRTVQIEVDDMQELFVHYEDQDRCYSADIEVPSELIYGLTDAQQAVEDALEKLNVWCVENGHGSHFMGYVNEQNHKKWQERQEYQKKVRAEQRKRKSASIRRGVTVVDG